MQLAVTLALVGLAAAFVARSAWRTWARAKPGCASGCGTCPAAPPAPPPPPGRVRLPMAD